MKRMSAVLTLAAAILGTAGTGCTPAPATSPEQYALVFRAAQAQDDVGAVRSRAQVFEGACDIRAALETYRTALGTLNPNLPGSLGSGRREINWDGVPAQLTNIDAFPADFFNQPAPGRARGVVFSTPGSGFRTSDNNLADLNPTYADEFDFFSPVKTFIAVGSNVTVVDLFVPGSGVAATSTGFGVVFSDIDHPGSAKLRLFDAVGRNLGTYLAPACPGGLSFLGVKFPAPIVASRVPSVPASSAGSIATQRCRIRSPVSIPSSIHMVVTPVPAHPSHSARCTGAAPR